MEQKNYDNMSVEEQVTAELIAIDVIATLRGCTRDEAMNLLYWATSKVSDALRKEGDELLSTRVDRERTPFSCDAQAFIDAHLREWDKRESRQPNEQERD